MSKDNRKYQGQQCQDDLINQKFKVLHKQLVNAIIQFCIENNIVIDEFNLSADDVEESIKFGSWHPSTDSSFVFEKFTDEYKDALTMNKPVDTYDWKVIKEQQEPYIYSI